MATPQYVYHMSKVSKTYPGGKQVLKDISLSFLPGAKIGVVGSNGSPGVPALHSPSDTYTDTSSTSAGRLSRITTFVAVLPNEPVIQPVFVTRIV